MTYNRTFDDKVDKIINFLRNDVLYHFTSLETGFEKILANHQLRFGKLIDVNDPKEFQINVPDIMLNNCGLICFSENKDELTSKKRSVEEELNDLGIYDPRMWAMYGQNHKGICLVFSKNRFINNFTKQFNKDRFQTHSNKVKYIKKNGIQIAQSSLNNTSFEKNLGKTDIANIMENQLFYKHSAWEYENEYRLLLYDSKSPQYHYTSFGFSLLAVILGTRVPDIYYKAINNVIPSNIFLGKTYWKNGLADTPCFSEGVTLNRAKFEEIIDDINNSK